VATGSKDGIVRRWEVPLPPRGGDADQVRRWVEAQTGLRLDRDPGFAMYAVAHQPLDPRITLGNGGFFTEPAR
jgi:hypothetical protein